MKIKIQQKIVWYGNVKLMMMVRRCTSSLMVVMAPPIVAIPNTTTDTMKQTIWTNVTQYVKYGLNTIHHMITIYINNNNNINNNTVT